MMSAETVKAAKAMLDALMNAHELREHLVKNPKWKLQLDAVSKDGALYGEVRLGQLGSDLRLTVVDFLIERLEARLRDLDVEAPAASANLGGE